MINVIYKWYIWYKNKNKWEKNDIEKENKCMFIIFLLKSLLSFIILFYLYIKIRITHTSKYKKKLHDPIRIAFKLATFKK